MTRLTDEEIEEMRALAERDARRDPAGLRIATLAREDNLALYVTHLILEVEALRGDIARIEGQYGASLQREGEALAMVDVLRAERADLDKIGVSPADACQVVNVLSDQASDAMDEHDRLSVENYRLRAEVEFHKEWQHEALLLHHATSEKHLAEVERLTKERDEATSEVAAWKLAVDTALQQAGAIADEATAKIEARVADLECAFDQVIRERDEAVRVREAIFTDLQKRIAERDAADCRLEEARGERDEARTRVAIASGHIEALTLEPDLPHAALTGLHRLLAYLRAP